MLLLRPPRPASDPPPRSRAGLIAAIAISLALASVLLGCAIARHGLYQSGAYDLACFDQPLYLLARGLPPISSVMGMHLLGDHAAWSLWPLAGAYALWPSVTVLFVAQAVALGAGALVAWLLARQAGCSDRRALVLAGAYAAYPLVFNANLFDFHPDAFVPALLMAALWAARAHRPGIFLASCLLAAGCKEVIGLTVAAMGLSLFLVERRRPWGACACALGLASCALAVGWIVPHFAGTAPPAIARYAYLGDSPLAIARTLVWDPQRWIGHVATPEIALYALYLLAPFGWALDRRNWAPLWPALPAFVLNVLADYPAQHDVVHHYALPVLPFLVAVGARALASGRTWPKRPGAIALWSVVGFLALAKPGYFAGPYRDALDTHEATGRALALVPAGVPVLTTHELAAQLAHRTIVRFTDANAPEPNLGRYGAILLNERHPGWRSSSAYAQALDTALGRDPRFARAYMRDGVVLYLKRPDARARAR